MGIFSAKSIDRQLSDAKASRDKIALRLQEAETAVASKKSAAKGLAKTHADDVALDKMESQLRAAEDRVKTLQAALGETTIEVQGLEVEAAKQADVVQRDTTVKTIDQHDADIVTVSTDIDASLQAVATLTEKLVPFIPDASGINQYARNARGELTAAFTMLRTLLRSHRAGVLNGSLPAVLAQPAPPPPALIAPLPLVWVFTLKAVSWTGHDGMLHTEHALFEAQLPPQAAARALRIGAACDITDPRRKSRTGFGKRTAKPQAADCVDLDVDNPTAPDPRATAPILASDPVGFTRIDRGPPITMVVPRGNPMPATATRSLPEKE